MSWCILRLNLGSWIQKMDVCPSRILERLVGASFYLESLMTFR